MFRGNNGRTRGRFSIKRNNNAKKNSWKVAQPTEQPPPLTINTTTQPMTSPPAGFSQAEIRDFQESFALFDTEGTGFVSVGDFRSVLESLQLDSEGSSTYPHLNKLIDKLSNYNSRENMDFDDYLQLMASTSLQQSLQEDADDQSNFSHVFRLFDTENKGYIAVEDLERIAAELGEQDMTRSELEEMIERAIAKGDSGRVTLPEFTKIMTLNLFQKKTGLPSVIHDM